MGVLFVTADFTLDDYDEAIEWLIEKDFIGHRIENGENVYWLTEAGMDWKRRGMPEGG